MTKKIKEGDLFPDFSLLDQDGNELRMADQLGKPLVVYFYPKDDTPGCTREACSFRDQYEYFMNAGAKVIGISSDSPEKHREFREKYALPFTLLSDPGGKVRKMIGVPTSLLGLIPGRVTYIIGRKGKVRKIFSSQLDFNAHVKEAIAVIRDLD